MRCSLLQCSGDLFGVLLMPLKNLEAGLQQALEVGIAGGRNERRLERAIYSLVICNFIGNVSLVEFCTIEVRQFGACILVSLSSGVTLSFTTRSSACWFTAVWSPTISSAKARTFLLLDFDRACLAASISSCPAV